MRPDPQIRDDHPPLFQIIVTERHPVHGSYDRPVGPAMTREPLGQIFEAIGKVITSGAMREWEAPWSDPRMIQITFPNDQSSLFTREDRAVVGDHRIILPH